MSQNAIQVSKEAQNNLKGLLDRARPALAAVLPKHLTPERLVKIALAATSRTPALLECTPQSILGAVMQAADLGLEPNTALGLSYLVPYGKQAQFIPGYRGLIRLAHQSGEVKALRARAIHAKDEWSVGYGTTPKIEHVPYTGQDDPGELVGVYAVVEWKAGGADFEFMSIAEVNRIRARSKASSSGPWKTDYEEMAKKTVIRRIAKTLPLSTENLARALEHQARAESGDGPDFTDVMGLLPPAELVEGTVVPEPERPKADSLKAKLEQAATATS